MNANVKKGTLLSVFGALVTLIGVAGVSALNGEFSNIDNMDMTVLESLIDLLVEVDLALLLLQYLLQQLEIKIQDQ